MEIIELSSPDIMVIKNFFSKEETESVLKVLKSYGEKEWTISGEEKLKAMNSFSNEALKTYESLWYDMSLDLTSKARARNNFPELPHELLVKKENEIKKIVEDKFNETVMLHLSGLHRWKNGREVRPHIDYYEPSENDDFKMYEQYKFSKDDLKNLPKDVVKKIEKIFLAKHYSALVYFNEDYIGGELYMPEFNWQIKPEPGMMIVFEGHKDHIHGVKKVEEGTRYTWSIFWTRKDWIVKNNLDILK